MLQEENAHPNVWPIHSAQIDATHYEYIAPHTVIDHFRAVIIHYSGPA